MKRSAQGLTTSVTLPPTMQIVSLDPMVINNADSSRQSLQITVLKEKMRYLEEGKALRESRCN